ncbi:hypothetical protein CspHIS471_0401490 [Cutaneotrichosporon sp. HIS471]|nr:hypothetical protein CspHIS471_0401490 [Cutaneotrichosporon sp. HIS471]
MKLSIAVVALAAGAHAFRVPPEVEFDFARFRLGHTGVARDLKERDAAPAPEAEATVDGRITPYGHQNQYNAPIFVETGRIPSKGERRPCHGKHSKGGFLSSLLTRLGFVAPQPFGGIRSAPQGEHRMHHGYGHDAPQKTENSEAPEAPEAGFAHILPIFGEGEPHKVAMVGEHEPSNGAEWIIAEFGSIADLESEEPEPEHKHKEHEHGKEHKHKGKKNKNKNKSKGGKKHKHGKDKHHKGKMYSLKTAGHKLCDALAELPPALRGFVVGALIGSMLQVLFSLVFLAVRLRRRKSCEARRVRRAERKEARKAAKAAYKANKAARKSKAAEAGYDEEEALPSYAEGETDALVVRQ